MANSQSVPHLGKRRMESCSEPNHDTGGHSNNDGVKRSMNELVDSQSDLGRDVLQGTPILYPLMLPKTPAP
jgi:hypothetical protein